MPRIKHNILSLLLFFLSEKSIQIFEQYFVLTFQVINNETEFRITLDISSFGPNEISLKTKNSRVVVHAKHGEREDEYGIIEREFKRQYILPKVRRV